MTNEISNKTLSFLLVGAIVVSLFGTFVSLNRLNKISTGGLGSITGLATNGTGTVDLTVTGQASFRLSQSGVNFGSITPNSSGFWITTETANEWAGGAQNNCSLITGLASDCSGIEIENDGNEVINISFNTSSNAASLIGGTAPAPLFSFRMVNGNRTGLGINGGCNGTEMYNMSGTGWQEIAADTLYELCNGTSNSGFMFESGQDRITLEFNLTIPGDAPQSASSATIDLWNLP
jgi:hypothetical protein